MLLTQLEIAQSHIRAALATEYLSEESLSPALKRHLETALIYLDEAKKFYEPTQNQTPAKRDFEQEFSDACDTRAQEAYATIKKGYTDIKSDLQREVLHHD